MLLLGTRLIDRQTDRLTDMAHMARMTDMADMTDMTGT